MDERQYARLAAREDAENSRRIARGETELDVTLLLGRSTTDKFKATGDDWRARMAEVLEKAKVG